MSLQKLLYTYEVLSQDLFFLDANEGTAFTASALFLDMHGYELRCRRGGIEHFAIRIATDMLSLEDIVVWLKKHTKKK